MEQGDRDKPTNRRKEQKEKKNEKSAEEKKLNRSCMVQIAQSLSLFLSLSLLQTHTHTHTHKMPDSNDARFLLTLPCHRACLASYILLKCWVSYKSCTLFIPNPSLPLLSPSQTHQKRV